MKFPPFLVWSLLGALSLACDDPEQEPASAEESSSTAVSQLGAAQPPTSTNTEAMEDAAEVEAAQQVDASLVILAGGDVSFGRKCGQRILSDPSYNPLAQLSPLLDSADLTLVNLESQLSDQGGQTQSPLNRLIFSGPPQGAYVLARAGIDVVSVANNHAWDYRKPAFLETLEHLDAAGVGVAGASATPGAQYKPLIRRVKGWSVAIFGVTQIWNQPPFEKHPGREHVAWANYERLQNEIATAKREYDLVLVSYHGGGEYIDIPMRMTREFVGKVMQTGVDALLGHHPHVVHGVRWFGTRPAFYSLGNLVFNLHARYRWTGIGGLARLTFTRDRPPRVELCPYRITGHTPQPFGGDQEAQQQEEFRRRFQEVSDRVGGTLIGAPTEYGCLELLPPEPSAEAMPSRG